jgi:glyoxylase-like metal-dependent hydrolase (beta-lactamase superfamily II)
VLDVLHARLERVTEGIHALAVWEPPPLKIFTSHFYVDLPDGGLVLIDAGRANHVPFMQDALAQLGKSPADVRAILATHHHADHVGGSALFPGAAKLIHPDDWNLLPEGLKPAYTPGFDHPALGAAFEVIHLGWHTPGSVAVFHRPTGVLFAGDHLGFYNLPAEGFVGYGQPVRQRACQRVVQWREDPKEREEDRLDLFVAGVRRLAQLPATALCVGHGGVLVGDIPQFLVDLAAAGE